MTIDNQRSRDPSAKDLEQGDDGDKSAATSVTELIDRIERDAFERYVSDRVVHRQYWRAGQERANP